MHIRVYVRIIWAVKEKKVRKNNYNIGNYYLSVGNCYETNTEEIHTRSFCTYFIIMYSDKNYYHKICKI